MAKKEIQRILDSDAGKELKEYLWKKLRELSSITSINEKDDIEQQAIEVKAQQRAYYKLKEILEELGDFSQEPKVKDPRDSYEVL